jgi:serine protease Do
MNKRWIAITAGVLAFFIVLGVGVLAGGTIAYLAFKVQPIQAALALRGPTPNPEGGVLVAGVAADSPAAQSGVVRGDILLSLDGQALNTIGDLQTALAQAEPGDTIDLTVLHGDETRSLSARLADENGNATLGIIPARPSAGDTGQFPPNFEDLQPVELPGAYITEVISDTPADTAGLEVGDIILAVEGQEVNADNSLADLIQGYQPDDTIQLNVQKAGASEPVEIEVTLGENPNTLGQAYLGITYNYRSRQNQEMPFFQLPEQAPGEGDNGESSPFDGLPLEPVLPSLPEGVSKAVLVSEVISGSPADQAGLEAGDLITAVDGEAIGEAEALVDIVQGLQPGDSLELTVYRAGQSSSSTIEVTLGENPDQAGAAYLGVRIGSVSNSLPEDHPPLFPIPTPDNNSGTTPNLSGGSDA